MSTKPWPTRLRGKMRRGFRGYPVGTVAFYGPDDRRASKVVAGIIEGEEQEPRILKKWFSDDLDVREDRKTGEEVLGFLRRFSVRSYVVTAGIIGCPNEEGVDYAEGEACPQCPYWASRDRWANA